ncbi:hypothetical protein DL95DRAFT_457473 [Leptodontidium sp. 2 PMI_412]|nr:hypothetical protein DL95DRAFT_457473 [Leptodontidium sp. 2 PMI_412]
MVCSASEGIAASVDRWQKEDATSICQASNSSLSSKAFINFLYMGSYSCGDFEPASNPLTTKESTPADDSDNTTLNDQLYELEIDLDWVIEDENYTRTPILLPS